MDDESDFRAELRTMLEDHGFAVVEAEDGRKALQYLTSSMPLPALVLCDLRMPQMTGWELSTLLRFYKSTSKVPLVLVSGADPFPPAHSAPPVPFLKKPVTEDRLFQMIDGLLADAGVPS